VQEKNITVLSFGGDGDLQVLKAMKASISLGVLTTDPLLLTVPTPALEFPDIPKSWYEWFHITPTTISYVQDIVHVAVKLKARLLNPLRTSVVHVCHYVNSRESPLSYMYV